MELQTNTKTPEKVKVSTIIVGILFICVSVVIALFVTNPTLLQQVMAQKGDILKGALIGVSALPIFLFLTIQGGKTWSKKWWVWVGIALTLCILLVIVAVMGSSTASTVGGSMPYMNNGGMYY